ncbi:7733_t:CDS:2 [Ambispora leptoticha]|uniref:7733_t:CDS:1 n=1 Tax=Ambispora leptoticha TaxID=144679 RepID=A0A9N9F0I5_9GLOM|nr:7733_t:CDS:2 [Ambispora leptoticha]
MSKALCLELVNLNPNENQVDIDHFQDTSVFKVNTKFPQELYENKIQANTTSEKSLESSDFEKRKR